MQRQICIQLIFIVALSVYGWVIVQRTPHSALEHKHDVIESNKRLLFVDGAGIDVRGELVNSKATSETKRVVAFLLRESTATQDVEFWRDVERMLPKNSGVRLVAYCDGSACAKIVRELSLSSSFPVILYGELIDSQAVLNADTEGAFVLKERDKSNRVRAIRWRDVHQRSEDIVRRVVP